MRLTTHKPSSAKVKNEWSYTSSPFVCLRGVYRDNFTFTSISVGTSCGDPHSLLFTRDFFQGLKWLGSEDERSPVHCASFKNA